MPDPDPVALTLWTTAVGWAVWYWLPRVVCAWERLRYENGGATVPAAIAPDGSDPSYTHLFAALTGLGHEPVGPGFMRLTLGWYGWSYVTSVRVFRHPAEGHFAFATPTARGWDVAFATCFEGGGLILTGPWASDEWYEEGNLLLVWSAAADVAALAGAHRGAVDQRVEDGWVPDPYLDLATLLSATAAHAYLTTIVPTAKVVAADVNVELTLQLTLVGVMVVFLGPWHWAPPGVWLVWLAARTAYYVWLFARAGGGGWRPGSG